MTSYRELEKQWLSKNPLRQWRADRNLYLKDVGAAVGARLGATVGYHTVYRWENGMSNPSEKQMAALVEITKIKNLQKKFNDWVAARPILGKEK